MQLLEKGNSPESEDQKIDLLNILADKYSRNLLNRIIDAPRSGVELSNETGIPGSTVYRKLSQMADLKLLKITGIISPEGKKVFLYQSKIKSVYTKFEGGLIHMEIIPNKIQSNL
ncbi:MAG: transcriptional regulator [Candidatus Nitrosopelagicus sp.]|jgi:predicted AAA+ superfamily ATPase|nr:transcriptional regulator [Candidatus Nitrosopelagicus sp.]|tara:strand:+ start:746 stop:1090 length:345 start_codon:yes stop_codon:yes gene_type:complete